MAAAINKTRTDQRKQQLEISNNGEQVMVQQKRVLVPVVYYLSRNGQLEHPHFMEVPLSSSHGLFLRDVIRRLNLLRGQSMAFHYSWSSKRSYKNGFVWQDLGEDDYIHPVNDGEYVLKGSEIFETTSLSLPSPSLSKSVETTSSSSGKNNINPSGSSDSEFPPLRNRRRNQSWGAIDLHEYKVYKAESSNEFAAADASTQTDDKRRRRKAVIYEEPEMEEEVKREKGAQEQQQQSSVELGRGEISPPPSDSSPETLESLMKADGRLINNNNSTASQSVGEAAGTVNQTAEYCQNGKMKASSVLMSLISCGSISFRDCGVTAVKDHGLSLISHYNKPRVPRGGNQTLDDDEMRVGKDMSTGFAKMSIEDKEYFSGSLIETNQNKYKEDNQFISLKRSASYNADRSSHLKIEGTEVEGVRAKCIPRRPKPQPSNKKECNTSEITPDINIEKGSQN